MKPDTFFKGKSVQHKNLTFQRDIDPILNKLKDKYSGYTYDTLNNNCNHFATEFIRELFNGSKRVPRWVNRAAWYGSWFTSCVAPDMRI